MELKCGLAVSQVLAFQSAFNAHMDFNRYQQWEVGLGCTLLRIYSPQTKPQTVV